MLSASALQRTGSGGLALRHDQRFLRFTQNDKERVSLSDPGQRVEVVEIPHIMYYCINVLT